MPPMQLMMRYDPSMKEPHRHIPLSERLKDWDGQPYELMAEDRAWMDMEPVGEEM